MSLSFYQTKQKIDEQNLKKKKLDRSKASSEKRKISLQESKSNLETVANNSRIAGKFYCTVLYCKVRILSRANLFFIFLFLVETKTDAVVIQRKTSVPVGVEAGRVDEMRMNLAKLGMEIEKKIEEK